MRARLALCLAIVAFAASGCGQRVGLPTPPPPPAIPDNSYIFDGDWTGYGGITDMVLTRYSIAPWLLVARDSARIVAYTPGTPAGETGLFTVSTAYVNVTQGALVKPVQIAEGVDGTLYVADMGAHPDSVRIVHLTANGSTVLDVLRDRRARLGDSLITVIRWREITGLAVDDGGNVFIAGLADSIDRTPIGVARNTFPIRQVRRITPDGTTFSVWSNSGGSSAAPNSAAHPNGLFFTGDGLLVADEGSGAVPSRVLKLSIAAPQTAFGNGFGQPDGFLRSAAQPEPSGLFDVTADEEGNIYVTDPPTGRVLRFTPDGTELLQLVNDPSQLLAGKEPPHTPRPLAASIAREPRSNLATSRVFIADAPSDRVIRYAYVP